MFPSRGLRSNFNACECNSRELVLFFQFARNGFSRLNNLWTQDSPIFLLTFEHNMGPYIDQGRSKTRVWNPPRLRACEASGHVDRWHHKSKSYPDSQGEVFMPPLTPSAAPARFPDGAVGRLKSDPKPVLFLDRFQMPFWVYLGSDLGAMLDPFWQQNRPKFAIRCPSKRYLL